MQIKHIIAAIEAFAPPALQESWDNTGLQTGDASAECTGVLICLDPTPEVIAEASRRGCNLVVSHHPLLFRGLKRITGVTPAERCVMEAIRQGIAVYSCHTALDSAKGGVSYALARNLGADVVRVLRPAPDSLLDLTVYVPRDRAESVRDALSDSGASDGQPVVSSEAEAVSDYMTADEAGLPVLDVSHEPLTSFNLVVPAIRRSAVEAALAGMGSGISYAFRRIDGVDAQLGLGVVAVFPEPVSVGELVGRVKKVCGASVLRCTSAPGDALVSRIAVCGGAGGEFIPDAVRSGADAYLTADVRYHDFGEWSDRIFILDAGHYETESCTKMLFMQLIKEKFANFAVYISETEKNPINYL